MRPSGVSTATAAGVRMIESKRALLWERRMLERENERRLGTVRHPKPVLPFEGKKGVCVLCGTALPPRKRSWCSVECRQKYEQERGFTYRADAIEANRKKNGDVLKCDSCSKLLARPYKDDWLRREFGLETVEPFDVDHIVRLADGGSHDLSNLQLLCESCHREKTAGEGRRRQKARGSKRLEEF